MRKKRKIKKYQQPADPRFPSPLVSKLITKIMLKGKKTQARGIVYQTFAYLEKELKQDPLVTTEEAIKELKPELETKKIRLGGTSQLVPKEVKPERSFCLALRWLVEAARKKTQKKRRKGIGRPIFYCLAQEIMEARQKSGEAFKKKETEQRKAIESMTFSSLNAYARKK
ncbi:30S ribosomal protein S7 [endosymbiont GvMRE of Glomus versiforme]|uniref:30S ribosomal protein S7 n=1 Tax=endosymbiont GvMRE of Glomus versiforme TaxID=2039283 RepID=UPI000EC45AC6|nr:30S ribosomal protein S7 [endosymbiont GvMRE of Glomus versiforme]RHZ37280.1 30S ribosomal protein S7 [endosymbiont GvMRE of Glomus versiforme]